MKVGDIVTYDEEAGNLILARVPREVRRVKLGHKGIITSINDRFYEVSWFGNGQTVNEALELNLCRGIKNKRLCETCRDRVECWKRRGLGT